MLRGSGIIWDLRLVESYDSYNLFDFSTPVGSCGDCYDRFVMRLEEMRQSLFIMQQALNMLIDLNHKGCYDYIIDDCKLAPPTRVSMKYDMSH